MGISYSGLITRSLLFIAKVCRHVVKAVTTRKVRACAIVFNFQPFARPLSIDQRAEDGGATRPTRLSSEIDHRNTRLDGISWSQWKL